MVRAPQRRGIQIGDCCSSFASPRRRLTNRLRMPTARTANRAEANSFPRNKDTLAPANDATNPTPSKTRASPPARRLRNALSIAVRSNVLLSGARLYARPLELKLDLGCVDI